VYLYCNVLLFSYSFPVGVVMQDRKVRRAIANGNERRRMQSINAGFEKLKELVCPLDKDKLSKVIVAE